MMTFRRAVLPMLAVAGALALGACDRNEAAPGRQSEAVVVTPTDMVLAVEGEIATGPVLSGSLEPERQAAVRAEVSGSVMDIYVQQGDAVRAGQLLARIDDNAIRDQYLSAQAMVRSAEIAAQNARRNLERAQRLAEAGAIAERDLEASRSQASLAQSQLADAGARLALARKQLDNTRVTAPIAGIVSDRSVDAGDVIQPGAPLFTVVDPSGMELRGAVPSGALSQLRVGAPVEFEVRGYPGRTFTGKVVRINPVADPVSRQVPVFVSIPNEAGRLVGGLYAEGRVATESRQGLVVPATAVDLSGNTPTVMRVQAGRAERVPVEIGLRDERTERILIASGLALGDTILVGAARGITAGTPVERGVEGAGRVR